MLKTTCAVLVFALMSLPLLAQNLPSFARTNQDQYIDIVATLSIPTNGDSFIRIGTLMTPSGLILTGLDAIDETGLDFWCDTDGHEQIDVALSTASYKACKVTDNFDHNFALLQIEARADGTAVSDLSLDIKPLRFEEDQYLTLGAAIYGVMLEPQLSFERGEITSVPLVDSTSGGLKDRNYFVDLLSITDEMLGTPIVDDAGDLVGITTQRIVDANQARHQLVRVIPISTICRVARDVCEAITPDDGLPPQDRTQIPSNALYIDTVVLDMEARAEQICKRYALVGRLADTESGWGCWKDSDNSLVREVTIAQIDDYCKETANNMDAFALLSGSGSKAYQWECYVPENG